MAVPAISERVQALVIEAAPIVVGEVHGAMSLTDDLGYDSLSLLELMSLLEAEFGLPPVDGDFAAVRTLQDAEDMVQRVLAAGGTAAGGPAQAWVRDDDSTDWRVT